MTGLLLFFVSAISLKTDGFALRESCDSDSTVIATLHRADPIQIRFGLADGNAMCYKVSVVVDGKAVEGSIPARALIGVEEFERERQNAASGASIRVLRAAETAPPAVAVKPGGRKSAALTDASRLIEQNQPNKALAILESSLRQSRKDPQALMMAGIAAYRSDNAKLALEYWKESLALEPNADVERIYRKVQKEVTGDKSGDKLYGLHVLLRYEGQTLPNEVARGMIGVLDEEFGRITEQLGCRSEERLVAIVQSKQAYEKSTDAAEWSGGQYDGRIRVALLEGQGVGPETRRAFAHEIVHACLTNLGQWPAWFQEGVAQKLSGDTLSPRVREQVAAMARAGSLPRLRNLSQSWSRLNTQHATVAYGVSLAAIELFLENYSEHALRNLINNPASLPQITEDLDRRLGLAN